MLITLARSRLPERAPYGIPGDRVLEAVGGWGYYVLTVGRIREYSISTNYRSESNIKMPYCELNEVKQGDVSENPQCRKT